MDQLAEYAGAGTRSNRVTLLHPRNYFGGEGAVVAAVDRKAVSEIAGLRSAWRGPAESRCCLKSTGAAQPNLVAVPIS